MSSETKRNFVEVTYKILTEEGMPAVKIRRLAKECGCTSTVIYRHFDNLNHLVAVASIRFLNEYLVDFQKMISSEKEDRDPYTLNLLLWECLASYAFPHAAIYENLFFGEYSSLLGDLIYEYYQLFHKDGPHVFDGFTASVMFNDTMEQRDLVLLRRAASMGILSSEDALILSRIEPMLFHGLLLKYKESGKDFRHAIRAQAEFSEMLCDLEAHYRKK